mgnify:CR=1 FL=1
MLVPGVFTHEECDEFVAYAVARKEEQMAHVAATPDEPIPAREREPAQTDPEMDMILHPKIRDALSDCMDVDGWDFPDLPITGQVTTAPKDVKFSQLALGGLISCGLVLDAEDPSANGIVY